MGVDSLPDLQTVFSKALRVSTKTSTSAPESSAMAATKGCGLGGYRSNGRGPSDSSGRPKCSHYGRLGHLVDRCWDLIGRSQTTHVTTESPQTSDNQSFTVS